ncbi:hypothetical protein ALC62_02345 [Cyphomyrmex costatus]|uniref:Uncharacterized protein n=1 Tax=Cyphomyrmex costatus TaxID=456900 RepID=A0A195D1E3_9HYME|nr:hypothetical protein ALC62_02345 [Cyphomyrmex costatus]
MTFESQVGTSRTYSSIYMPFSTKFRTYIKIIFFYLLWHYNLEPDMKINVHIMLNKKTFFIMEERDFRLKW